ncbi:MAG: MFS transporter [Pseudomonadota bacterium]
MIRQILPVIALFLSTAFLLAGGGMQGVLLPIRGQLEGFTASQIGYIGTGWAVGFTAGCLFVPHFVRRVGHVRTFGALAALLATVVLLNGLIIEAYSWILLRALAGFCFAGSYMIIESWLNEGISDEHRGAMFSVYMIISQTAFMGGQYLLIFAEPSTTTLFMMGAVLYSLAIIPTALSKARSPAPLTQVKIDLKGMFFNSPTAFFGSLVAGILASTMQTFGPVFGLENGLSITNIANMMALIMLGAICFQFPLGKMSDRTDRRYVMVGLSLTGALVGFAISNYQVDGANPSIIFFVLMVLLGGFIYPIYGLVNAHANDHAAPGDFVKISSSLLILYGIGNMIGPLLTGAAMEWLGTNALFQIIGLSHFLLACHMTYRIMRREAPDDDQTMDYQNIPMGVMTQSTETAALDPRSDYETYMMDDGEENTAS